MQSLAPVYIRYQPQLVIKCVVQFPNVFSRQSSVELSKIH